MFKINERPQCQENTWVLITLLYIVTKAGFSIITVLSRLTVQLLLAKIMYQ